jgi:hypothetical protein
MIINIQVPDAANLLYAMLNEIPPEKQDIYASRVNAVASFFQHPNLDDRVIFTLSSDSTLNDKIFAFSDALALESVREELNSVPSDALIRYAKTIAYKVFHNLKNGFLMNPVDDPTMVDDIPA